MPSRIPCRINDLGASSDGSHTLHANKKCEELRLRAKAIRTSQPEIGFAPEIRLAAIGTLASRRVRPENGKPSATPSKRIGRVGLEWGKSTCQLPCNMPTEKTHQPDEKLWRPFLRLAKYLPDEFVEKLEHWHYLVSSFGSDQTPERPVNKEDRHRFFTLCHDGWKQAQTEISEFLTTALEAENNLTREAKECHRQRDKLGHQALNQRIRQVGLQIKFSRRMLDVILWTILKGEHSTLRRLIVAGGQNSLSPANIREGMAAANQINKDPLTIALSTDILSLVHVGDLIVADQNTGQIKFVELKSGGKNIEIARLAAFAVESGCERFEALATDGFSDTDKDHFSRVKRQTLRNTQIVDTILNEGGVDPNTGNKVTITPSGEPTEFWNERICACYEKLTPDKQWAIDVIEDCVFLGVYTDQKMAFVGFQSWMKINECESPIFNLMDSFLDPGVRPLGALDLPKDLRLKILRGEVIVIMCLDVKKLLDLGNKLFPGKFRLASKAESASMQKREKRIGSLTLQGRLIAVEAPDSTMYIGQGIRDRILFDQHSPTQLLRHQFIPDNSPDS